MKLQAKQMMMVGVMFLFAQSAIAGEKWVLDLSKGSGKVDFHAVGAPKMLKIHGEGAKPSGQLEVENGKVSGQAIFDLSTLKTGIDMRDKHMKDKYLQVSKHKNAILEITSIKLPSSMPSGDFSKDAPFQGKLTVRGVASNVSGVAKLTRSGNSLKGEVEFKTKIKAHGIDLPSFAGITVADEVTVQVEFTGPLSKQSNVASNR